MSEKYPQVSKNGEGSSAMVILTEGPALTVSAPLSMMQKMAAEGPSQKDARHLAGPSRQQAQTALNLLRLQHS